MDYVVGTERVGAWELGRRITDIVCTHSNDNVLKANAREFWLDLMICDDAWLKLSSDQSLCVKAYSAPIVKSLTQCLQLVVSLTETNVPKEGFTLPSRKMMFYWASAGDGPLRGVSKQLLACLAEPVRSMLGGYTTIDLERSRGFFGKI